MSVLSAPLPSPPPPPSSRNRHSSLLPYLLRVGPFSPGYERDATAIDILRAESRVLVVGAGGLGCELLKGLALSCVYELHVVDLDTIDVSNLNRQFLFRLEDCGQPKAKVAAERVMARCPGVTVHWYNKPLQDFPPAWYSKFDVVIAGLSDTHRSLTHRCTSPQRSHMHATTHHGLTHSLVEPHTRSTTTRAVPATQLWSEWKNELDGGLRAERVRS